MTQTATAARYSLTVVVRGWDQNITRDFDKVAIAVQAAKGAATHPSCISAMVVCRDGSTAYATRYED